MRLLGLIPRDYKDSFGAKFDYNPDTARERLLRASGKSTGTASTSKLSQAAYNTRTASASLSALAIVAHAYGYPSYGTINQRTRDATMTRSAAILSPYDPYNTSSATIPVQASQPYAPVQSSASTQPAYQPTAQTQYSSQYSSAGLYAARQPLQLPGPLLLSRLHKVLAQFHLPCLLPKQPNPYQHPRLQEALNISLLLNCKGPSGGSH